MLPAATQSLVAGEFVMTADDFRRIAATLRALSGIVVTEGKATLVYSRLAKRLRLLGIGDFRSYCKLVTSASGAEERQCMLSALTTNLTRFFREPHHFAHLQTTVLPPLMAVLRRGGRVRLWSAACSNGAEPYSIAMTVLSAMPDAANYDIRILGTDIDKNMIEAARHGVYETDQVRDAPRDLLGRWMVPGEQDGVPVWSAGDDMRRLIAFRELNLIGEWPMKGRFDAIFCRNVVIYFDEPTQNEIWRRFADVMAPSARLYIGHSERIASECKTPLRPDGVTTYAMDGPQP